MKKILIIAVVFVVCVVSLFYFDAPLNLIRPVFHADLIKQYSAENNLDPLLVTALIKTESNFVRRARSNRGAVGLMQLLPATAQELAGELGYKDVKTINLEDPRTNIRLGTHYLAALLSECDGNEVLALAAYNAGLSKVQTWYRQNPLLGMEIADIPYPETRNYVSSIMRTHRWLKKIQDLKNLIRAKKA